MKLQWTDVVYFDQLWGACSTQKLVELLKSTKKSQIQGTPSGSRPAFACRPALRSRQNIEKKISVHLKMFLLISAVKSLKMFKINKKRLKTAEKSNLTSLWLVQAPKS